MKERLFKKGYARRLFSVLLALTMVLALMPMIPLSTVKVNAEESYSKELCFVDDGTLRLGGPSNTPLAVFPEGISYDTETHEWTMEDFHVTSSNYMAVSFVGENVLNLKGENSIACTYDGIYRDSKVIECYKYTKPLSQLTIKGEGKLVCTSTANPQNASYGIYTDGNLIIDGGDITVKTGDSTKAGSYGIRYQSMTVNGGSLDVTAGDAASGSYGLYCSGNSALTINGGTIKATSGAGTRSMGSYTSSGNGTAVVMTGGNLIVTGGTAVTASYGMYAYGWTMSGGTLTAHGGKVTGDDGVSYGIIIDGGSGWPITGGVVTATGETVGIFEKREHISFDTGIAVKVGSNAASARIKDPITSVQALLTSTENKYAKILPHTHGLGEKQEAVDSTCTTKGTIEHYKCTDSTCDAVLSSTGTVLSNVEVALNPANHTYGTTGASRYTCTGCGHVDTDKRDAIDTTDTNAANAVIDKIEAIGTVALTDESKAKIDAARSAYDALTEDQKAKVTETQLKVLTDAEAKYKELANAGKYEGVDPTSGEVKDITGTPEAPEETNHYSAAIENSSELETLLEVPASDKAQGVNVWIELVDAKDSMPVADKTLIEEKAGTKTVGVFLDATLFKKVGDNEAEAVHELNGKIKVSLVVPEDIRKEGRTYGIVRVHDGVATAIDGTFDAATHTFTFETDRFSSYALIYEDAATGNGGTETPAQTPTETPTKTPGTGDASPIALYVLLMGLAGVGMLVSKKRRTVR